MRAVLVAAALVIGVVIAGLLGAAAVVELDVPLPRIGPDAEQVCAQTMRTSGPDRSWVAPRYATIRPDQITSVTWGELRVRHGEFVEVAGFLHAELEWVALYPSRRALEELLPAPWVNLEVLWLTEPAWPFQLPLISDRCAVVTGSYSKLERGHMGMFAGTIDALRLDVWATPHRPFRTAQPPPPPPAPALPIW